MTKAEAAKRLREKAEDHYYIAHLRQMYLIAAEALERELRMEAMICPHCGKAIHDDAIIE